MSGDETSRSPEKQSAKELFPLVYDELHKLAEGFMRRERAGHTLQPTALVNEAYLRLSKSPELKFNDRTHFIAIAARSIRQVLVDHAKRHKAKKRGGNLRRVTLDEGELGSTSTGIDVLALNDALSELDALDHRQCEVVVLRYFGGLDVDETAQVIGVSPRTIKGDWRFARAWLRQRLSR